MLTKHPKPNLPCPKIFPKHLFCQRRVHPVLACEFL